jgi:hypothetical protein
MVKKYHPDFFSGESPTETHRRKKSQIVTRPAASTRMRDRSVTGLQTMIARYLL